MFELLIELTTVQQIDFRAVTLMHDEHLTRYHDEWAEIFATESDRNGMFRAVCDGGGSDVFFFVDRGSAFRCTLLPLYVDRSFHIGGVLMMGQLCGLLTPCDVLVWVPAGVSAGDRAWGRSFVQQGGFPCGR